PLGPAAPAALPRGAGTAASPSSACTSVAGFGTSPDSSGCRDRGFVCTRLPIWQETQRRDRPDRIPEPSPNSPPVRGKFRPQDRSVIGDPAAIGAAVGEDDQHATWRASQPRSRAIRAASLVRWSILLINSWTSANSVF